MQLRTELALALTGLGLLAALAAAVGRLQNRAPSADPRHSTYLTGPQGARGLAEALERLNIRVKRFRQRSRQLTQLPRDSSRVAFVVLDPTERIHPGEVQDFLDFAAGPGSRDLILAGPGAGRLLSCFGYAYQSQRFDSVQAIAPGSAFDARSPWVNGVLAASTVQVVTDSSAIADQTVTACSVPTIAYAETLLVTRTGRVEALRLYPTDVAHSVVLIADGALLSNQALRETDAGPFALGLFVNHYDVVYFEESHHGFAASGSLASVAFAWSRGSPWGWAVWQLAVVGTLALLLASVRFGPPRPAIPRKRRSPLEHVRALATALAAAQGHDVAVTRIVQGLRRRLTPGGHGERRTDRRWISALDQTATTPRGHDAVRILTEVTRPGQPALSVLRAANAVEDVWEELRP
jgi:hypothetical protein